MPIEPGQQISHYRLIKKIGEGGMGVVWRAEDTRLHRHVALKFVPDEREEDRESVDRHLREARAASTLNHPHICSIHDIGEWEGRRFIVMELLEGRTLRQHIGGEPMQIDAAVDLAFQIADALAAAHDKGVIHRDIKTTNIFVTDLGGASQRAKVLDFGLAKLAVDPAGDHGPDDPTLTQMDVTTPGAVVGTISFMSPEQALGKDVDSRTDIFSLGVVLYEMITARRAFEGDTSAAVFDAILNRAPMAPVELNAAVPRELERIVNKALEKDPALRYQSAAGLRADLTRLGRDASSGRAAAGSGASIARPVPIWKRKIAIAAASIAIVVLAFIVWQSEWQGLDRDEDAMSVGDRVDPNSSGPSIAVLPFTNASQDQSQRYFSDGLTQDIITELSLYRELSVIAYSATSEHRDSEAGARQIGHSLGARYVLQGSVRRSGDRIRLSVELSDALDGRSVWGTRYERELTARDLFEIQDELTQHVVNAIAGTYGALARAELPRARREPPASLDSYDCVLRAFEYLHVHTGEKHLAALTCMEQVVAADPAYADGTAWLAYLVADAFHHRWNERPEEYDSLDRALELAKEAVRLDQANYLSHAALSLTYFFRGDVDRGKSEAYRTVELAPNNAFMLALMGVYLTQQGEFEDGIRIASRGIELNPHPPQWVRMPLFYEAYRRGRYEEALVEAKTIVMEGDFREPLFVAASLGQLGRLDEARPYVEDLRVRWGRPFEEMHDELLERHACSRALVDHLMEGLEAAMVEQRLILVVLPFENIGGDPDQEFFVDGMTEEIITVLGGADADRLGVIARTSAMRFKDSDLTVREIGTGLGAHYVVEGSVRRQGAAVRISAKLIDVGDETQLWTQNFDGTLGDIFGLQSEVATRIAESLAVTLLVDPKSTGREHVPDPAAYEQYLAGRFWDHKGTEPGWKQAIAHYQKAVEIDPAYAIAYASLSQTHSTLATWTTIDPAGPISSARAAMDRAFELDPDLADAYVALAFHQMLGEWKWEEVDTTFRRALAAGPNNPGMAHHWYGHYLSFMDRHSEAKDAFAASLELDPLSPLHRACLGLTQINSGDLDLADQSLRQALKLSPELPVAFQWLGLLREREGRLEDALAAWREGALHGQNSGLFSGPLGYGYGRLGRIDDALDVLEQLRAGGDNGYVAELNLARVYAGMGELDAAFEQLEIAYAKREPWILAVKIGPGFDTLRDDPRYADLMRRIGVEP